MQRSPIDKPDVDIEDITIAGGPQSQIAVRVIKPAGATGTLPVILYIHGAGWVLGSPQTHDLLVRNLAVGAEAAVVFPHYRRAPEAQYPAQIQEAYATAEWITEHGTEHDLDPTHLAIAGDSCGGNLAIAVTLMAKERGGPSFAAQLLYYPVTDAGMDTGSYQQFAEGYFLTAAGMAWFWDRYLPDADGPPHLTRHSRTETDQLVVRLRFRPLTVPHPCPGPASPWDRLSRSCRSALRCRRPGCRRLRRRS